MNDATVTWGGNNATGVPTGYLVQWFQNGKALPPVTVPQTAAQDAAGYSSDFTSATGITPAPGDTIAVTVQEVSSVTSSINGVATASTPASVQIPTAPVQLSTPSNVVLALS